MAHMPEAKSNLRDPWWAVLLVLLSLVGALGAIVVAWLPVAPQSPNYLEKYYPYSSGISLRYRVIAPDQTTRYQSRNIEALRGGDILPSLDTNAFGALVTALGLNIEQFDVNAAQEAVGNVKFARIVDIDYRDREAFTTTVSLLMPHNGRLALLRAGNLSFDPPLPDLIDFGKTQEETFKGRVNGKQPYTVTLALETRESIDTPVGRMEDCLRVRQTILLATFRQDARAWYCAGVGVARQEVTRGESAGMTRYELIAISAPRRLASVAPPITGASPSVSNRPSLPARGRLSLAWAFEETHSASSITTVPIAVNNLILYGTRNGGLVTLDRQTQKPKWRFQTGSTIYGVPAIAGSTVFIASTDRRLYAVDLQSGAFQWAFAAQDAIAAAPATSDGIVYVASEDRNLYALDAESGKERWRFAAAGPIATAPVVANGVVYVGSDDGVLYAIDARSGAVRWAFLAGDAITTSAIVHEGMVYISAHNKTVFALKASSVVPEGEMLWSYNVGKEYADALVISGDRLLLATQQEVRALDLSTGRERWRYASKLNLYGAPIIMGDELLIRREHDVLVLDAQNGSEREVFRTSESAAFAGLGSDGQEIFVSHYDGLLQVLGKVQP